MSMSRAVAVCAEWTIPREAATVENEVNGGRFRRGKPRGMKMHDSDGSRAWFTIVLACAMTLLLPAGSPVAVGETVKPTLAPEERLRLGEQMYRKGILPSGEPMRAFVKGDIPVPGTAFSCESCHMRAGIGSIEGEVYTPPTNGSSLFQPRKKYYKGVEIRYDETLVPAGRPTPMKRWRS